MTAQLLDDSSNSALSTWLFVMSTPHSHSPCLKLSPWTGVLSEQTTLWFSSFSNYPWHILLGQWGCFLECGLFSRRSWIWSPLVSPVMGHHRCGPPEPSPLHCSLILPSRRLRPASHPHRSQRKTHWTMSRESVIAKTREVVEIYEGSLLKMKAKRSKATVPWSPTRSTWALLTGVWAFVWRDRGSGFQSCDFRKTVSSSWGVLLPHRKERLIFPTPSLLQCNLHKHKNSNSVFCILQRKSSWQMAIIPKTSTQKNLVLHLALLTKYMTITYHWHRNSLRTWCMSRSTSPLRSIPLGYIKSPTPNLFTPHHLPPPT